MPDDKSNSPSSPPAPRVVVEIPGYWCLPAEDQEFIDRLMRERKAERQAAKNVPKAPDDDEP